MTKKIRYAIWLISLFAGCFFLVRHQVLQGPVATTIELPGTGDAKIGGGFELIDQHGNMRSSESFKGKVQMIYFGYSFCPDICPLGLQNMSGALELLQRDRDQVAAIFITVDPARDTVDSLKLYATNFHQNFVMLTGGQSAIDQAIAAFKVYAVRAPHSQALNDYLIDHSTLVYVMDRQGTYVKQFPHTTPPEEIKRALLEVLYPLPQKEVTRKTP